MQAFIYITVCIEILLFVHFPFSEQIMPLLSKMAKIPIYSNILYSKLFTFFIIMVTCIGTRSKKDLELDPTKQIIFPLIFGFIMFFGSICFLFFKEKGETYFHKIRHEGFLRHLVMRRSVKTGDILINLVTTTQSRLDESEFVNMILSQKIDGKVVGILHTLNDNLADVVQSDETKTLYGQDYFYEYLYNMRFKISPFSFFQTNTLGAEVLYDQVREYVGETKDKLVYDLYTGTGTIAQMLAPVASKVVGVEIVEEAVEAAKKNAVDNHLDNCEFIAGDVLKVVDNLTQKPDILVLDPPRDGIHPKALRKIINFNVDEMVYVSCKPTSLMRDLLVFREAGYEVKRCCLVDMFPGTVHVETVCLLSRKDK